MIDAVPDEATAARNRLAREKALDAMSRVKPAATPVVRYLSQGRVVVIGGMEALEFAPRLQGPLKPVVLLVAGVEEPGVTTIPLGGRRLSIEGHLGDFTLRLGEKGRPGYEQLRADLVLDLQPEPHFGMPLPPPGYLVASPDEPSLSAAALQLEALVGTFEKPHFVGYDPSLCAHQRAGQVACTRCIDACPAEAITSIAEAVEVDADRCQGGGACATVCPSGAMRYDWPGVEDALQQVKTLLESYRDAGGTEPVLVLLTEAGESETPLPPNHLPYRIEELAGRGLEFWFGALGYGARSVLLLQEAPLPARVARALEQQLEVGRRILEALGYPDDALRLAIPEDMPGEMPGMPPIEPARFAPVGEKRQLFFTALDHLYRHAERSRPLASLEAGAPFGIAQIDAARCTLCNACVGACPGNALQLLEGGPGIGFLEANCLQCGMCTRTCPEDAIAITPRLLFDRDKRNRVRRLHSEEPFHCISCGKAFATASVIERMQQALQGHWMFQDERARNRLKMCDECRVVDIAADATAMEQASGIRLNH